ncbi:MAG: hypothetical protein ACLP50_18005 [Solirubrobacteraceae bacterium]
MFAASLREGAKRLRKSAAVVVERNKTEKRLQRLIGAGEGLIYNHCAEHTPRSVAQKRSLQHASLRRVGTSTAKQIEDILRPAWASFRVPFVIPVHARAHKKYRMTARISGTSLVTDVNDRGGLAIVLPGPDVSDETAKATARLKMCQEVAFNKGGTVDNGSKRTAALKNNTGIEYNIEGLERTFAIFGQTDCECLPSNRLIDTWIEPDIYVETDGAFGGASCAISINEIMVEYEEKPCRHATTPEETTPAPEHPHVPPPTPEEPSQPQEPNDESPQEPF